MRDPDHPLDAKEFADAAHTAMRDIQNRGKKVILVVGTNLYFKAIVHGIANLPAADSEFRESLEAVSTEVLYASLLEKDPTTAFNLHHNDRTRIIRSLEVFHLSGDESSRKRTAHGFQEFLMPCLAFVLWWPRDILHTRIQARANAMIDQGVLEETESVRNHFGNHCRALKTIGYQECEDLIGGRITKEQLEEKIVASTRRLAKQQRTFWKNEPQKRGWEILPNSSTPLELETFSATNETYPERVAKLSWKETLAITQDYFNASNPRNTIWHISARQVFSQI